MSLAQIESLELPLREAHAVHANRNVRGGTFQAFVDRVRFEPSHPLYETAIEYNRAVYRMQSQIGEVD